MNNEVMNNRGFIYIRRGTSVNEYRRIVYSNYNVASNLQHGHSKFLCHFWSKLCHFYVTFHMHMTIISDTMS
jgi:hypothetical protein